MSLKPKKYNVAVVIGRYQPLHNGHIAQIEKAMEIADNVIVLVGSSFQPRTPKNPLTYAERSVLIGEVFMNKSTRELDNTMEIRPIRDYLYEDNKWLQQVQGIVSDIVTGDFDLTKDARITIVGHDKDDSTWYLRHFPTYHFHDTGSFVEFGEVAINATAIRQLMFERQLTYVKGAVHPCTYSELKAFTHTEAFETLVEEYEYLKAYKEAWAVAPHPPTFNTVDSVVLQGGHVLLIQRAHSPGKGLWALPGGFLDPDETCLNGMMRELKEETRIKTPEPILRGCVSHEQRFDHPKRSLRGRTITDAFLIELPGPEDGKLPRVKGADDAKVAKWFPIHDALNMSDKLFEDHHSIISMLVARAK